MKERAKQLADDHWNKYVGPMLRVHGVTDNLAALCEFHYKTATIHGHGHGVEDERNRAKGVSAAVFGNPAHVVEREPLDLRLPAYALPCTEEEAKAQWESETREYNNAEAGSFLELIEAWDVLQSVYTWYERSGANHMEDECVAATHILSSLHSEGRPVARARRAMLIKNAARGYYSLADCARILADV